MYTSSMVTGGLLAWLNRLCFLLDSNED